MEIRFTIDGEPVAKGRPKFSTVNGFAVAYTPEKTANYETLIKLAFLYHSHGGTELLTGPLQVDIIAEFSIPKSTSKKNKSKMINKEIFPTKKPDADNIAKSITDALNTLAYKDDSQIVFLTVKKIYSEHPCVKVIIKDIIN